jgi:hypothetical protein
MTQVPKGDWLCTPCLEVLQARREHYQHSSPNTRTLQAQLPALPEVPTLIQYLSVQEHWRLQVHVSQRKATAFQQLEENQKIINVELKARIERLKAEQPRLQEQYLIEEAKYKAKVELIKPQYRLSDWGGANANEWIEFIQDGRVYKIRKPSSWRYSPDSLEARNYRKVERLRNRCQATLQTHREPFTRVENELEACREELAQSQKEDKDRYRTDEEERQTLVLEFASLLSDPQYEFETNKMFQNREPQPAFLGVCKLEDELDVQVLHMLREPTELILAIPMEEQETSTCEARITTHQEYAIFGRAALFCPERDDSLPMDFSNASIRSAQRRLVAMLLRDTRNQALVVSQPTVPSSVQLRGTSEENMGAVAKCFDLSELVRDCNCPLNMPKAPTPKQLADNGLVLRDYQQASLQWMLDKENNPTGMGLGGELWYRMQFLDGTGDFYYCEITGSFIKDIFDFKSDAEQQDVARHYGSLPTGGILGEE